MRIIYIGCVKSSYVFLKVLIENNVDIVGVITKKKSEYNSDFFDLVPLCKNNNIPYIYFEDVDNQQIEQFIKNLKPDIGYCFGWSHLLHSDVINLFPKGIVGYHPSFLPYNRGRHPIIWALALGLEYTASSFFKIDETADTGDILLQEKVDIAYEDNAGSLMDKLLVVGTSQVIYLTRELEKNNVNSIKQNKEEGNYWRKRDVLDGQIDWRMSSRNIYNLVRALYKPYVGAHTIYHGQKVKIWKVRELTNILKRYNNIEPGKVIKVVDEKIYVKTGDNIIVILEHEFLNSVKVGEYLK